MVNKNIKNQYTLKKIFQKPKKSFRYFKIEDKKDTNETEKDGIKHKKIEDDIKTNIDNKTVEKPSDTLDVKDTINKNESKRPKPFLPKKRKKQLKSLNIKEEVNDADDKDFTKDFIKVKKFDRKLFNKNKIKKNFRPKPLEDGKPDPQLVKKHTRGFSVDTEGVKTNFFKTKLKKKEIYMNYATELAARTEILLTEEPGYLEADPGERTCDYRQQEIVQNVNLISAAKYFNLNLQFGPYHHRYTKNGRHLLLGGKRGHVAAFDWMTKKLHCEINVMEELADLTWLHVETMFACAQKNWTYFYDNKGTELHCVKRLYSVNKLEFLPYHFLLATGSSTGYLSWLDITIGEIVGQYNSKLGDIRIMCQNSANGVLCVGGGKGVVSMWTPKIREPVAKILCHPSPMTSMAIDPLGKHLLTAGLDRNVKLWDIRNLGKALDSYILRMPANNLAVSQKGTLAFSMGYCCEVYRNCLIEGNPSPYLKQNLPSYIHDLRFCPYEDILGISHAEGFQSMLVPGSGEPNFDSYEANPFQTPKQRRENEIHGILEKIPAAFITLDPNEIGGVDIEKLTEKIDAKKQLFFVKPPQIDFTSRRKKKGKGGAVKAAKNKQIIRELKRKEFITNLRTKKTQVLQQHGVKLKEDYIDQPSEEKESPSVLDRFKSKKSIRKTNI